MSAISTEQFEAMQQDLPDWCPKEYQAYVRELFRAYTIHLTQPAQAVDVEHEMVLAFRAGAKWADEHVAPDGRLIGKLLEPRALTVARASNEYAGERTAALPNANGKEG